MKKAQERKTSNAEIINAKKSGNKYFRTNIWFARTFHIRIDQTRISERTLAIHLASRTSATKRAAVSFIMIPFVLIFLFLLYSCARNYGNKFNIVCVNERASERKSHEKRNENLFFNSIFHSVGIRDVQLETL